MKLVDFKQRLQIKDDIPFSYKGKEYVILGWYNGGPLLCECGNDENAQQFKDYKDLLENCYISGENIKSIIEKL